MKNILRNLWRSDPPGPLPAIPGGERVYAIGDIHGRLDLFRAIAEAIERDDEIRGSADTTVILLGDLVDRGPDSAGVVDYARQWAKLRKIRFIGGNHEEMFLLGFYKLAAFKSFQKIGGRETLLSYGIEPRDLLAADLDEAQRLMIDAVPMADREFLHSFEKLIAIGDYLFVHAGINPARPLNEQRGHDCRWIREPFLKHTGDFGQVVIHGHTVTEDPVIRNNRIGIDTGAFMSGRLTAIGLEGTERWILESREADGEVETFAHAA